MIFSPSSMRSYLSLATYSQEKHSNLKNFTLINKLYTNLTIYNSLFILEQYDNFPWISICCIAFSIENTQIIRIYLDVGIAPAIIWRWHFYLFVKSQDSLIWSADQHCWLAFRCLNVLFALKTNMSLSMECYFYILLTTSKTPTLIECRYRIARQVSRFLSILEIYLLWEITHFWL